jgi:hypothetical protein
MVPAEVVAEDWYTYSWPSLMKRPPWAAAGKEGRHHSHYDQPRLGLTYSCELKLLNLLEPVAGFNDLRRPEDRIDLEIITY